MSSSTGNQRQDPEPARTQTACCATSPFVGVRGLGRRSRRHRGAGHRVRHRLRHRFGRHRLHRFGRHRFGHRRLRHRRLGHRRHRGRCSRSTASRRTNQPRTAVGSGQAALGTLSTLNLRTQGWRFKRVASSCLAVATSEPFTFQTLAIFHPAKAVPGRTHEPQARRTVRVTTTRRTNALRAAVRPRHDVTGVAIWFGKRRNHIGLGNSANDHERENNCDSHDHSRPDSNPTHNVVHHSGGTSVDSKSLASKNVTVGASVKSGGTGATTTFVPSVASTSPKRRLIAGNAS